MVILKQPKDTLPSARFRRRLGRRILNDWQIYLLLLPAVAYLAVFIYSPMYGLQIVFRNYKFSMSIPAAKWVGLKNFEDFFKTYYFWRLLRNTFLLNLFNLACSFPIPIVMAILLNQLDFPRIKRFTQTSIYVPHFISTTVMAGMLYLFLSPTNGIVNHLIKATGGNTINFMVEAGWFRPLYIGSDIWQHAGWNTILYIAALTGIDPGIYEAATIDGATKWQKIRHIDVPHLKDIAGIILILSCGALLTSNTDKTLLMQTPGNMATSDIIGLYVYTMGLAGSPPQPSYTAAIGLFVNVINFVMIYSVNWIVKHRSETSLL